MNRLGVKDCCLFVKIKSSFNGPKFVTFNQSNSDIYQELTEGPTLGILFHLICTILLGERCVFCWVLVPVTTKI